MKQVDRADVASQRVADILAERIASGILRPGERIKQDELAAELDMSRIPVRDALRILESRGMVTMRANSSARVISLTAKDMDLSYRIRELLEPMLLAESLPNLTDADITEMQVLKEQLNSFDDIADYMPLSRRFHWAAFSGHRAPLLAQLVERLWDTTENYRRAYAQLTLRDEERMQAMRDERNLLFEAISQRDCELAPLILGMHIRRTHSALLEFSHLHEELAG